MIEIAEEQASPTVSRRTQNPAGFYYNDWDEFKQEENEWQTPDKWQRISQIVFCGECLDINPEEDENIPSFCTQHQGGVCSVLVAQRT